MIKKTYPPNDVLFASKDERCYDNLEYIQRHLLREDFSLIKKYKQTFFYDHPALKEISQYVIKTDNLILINSDYFNTLNDCEIFNNYKIFLSELHPKDIKTPLQEKLIRRLTPQLDNVQFIKNLFETKENNTIISFDTFYISHPVVKMTDQELLKILKDSNLQRVHNILENEFKNIDNVSYDSLFTLSARQKSYITEFKTKIFPTFIHNYYKTFKNEGRENANQLGEYFAGHIGSEGNFLSTFGFALIISQFSAKNIETEYNVTIPQDDITKMIQVLYKAEHINNNKRRILIEEVSNTSDLQLMHKLIACNKYFQPKKKM